ncbi:hypothetical protein SAMN05216190_11160 [Pseudomonas borbori]|uniref:Uncharacterized protein n=1 Tax=Pseudomonas borbori TaxID=289003 RepID=A0A1I5QQE0_9PSED|nr:hypothetical protein SAMN05216190_11160 [Pseudomonas borbori]
MPAMRFAGMARSCRSLCGLNLSINNELFQFDKSQLTLGNLLLNTVGISTTLPSL